MKTIGLVGGTSWVSSVDYYKLLNERIHQHLGGLNYAQCILYSLNFAEFKKLTDKQDWAAVLTMVTEVSRNLAFSGAECILLCANTMHVIADDLRKTIDIPVLHIAEATAEAITQRSLKKIGLLGTKFTMEMDFFKKKLSDRSIETVIPSDADREFIHATIYDELGKGIFQESTKRRYLGIIDTLASNGAEGIVMGCTEIPLLIKQSDSSLPLFDTVSIHVDSGVKFALNLENPRQ
jgi:aspartate racemase